MGEPSFVDKLRSLVETKPHRTTGADPVARSHDEAGAEKLARRALAAVGLPSAAKSLSKLRKGDTGKVLVAVLLRERTAVGNRWVAQRLAMGHTGSVSRLVGAFGKKKEELTKLRELEEMLQCDT